MAKIGEHAVVLGASMSGLLTARVLADFYDGVTVVERDVLSDDAANRRGVPQGRHAHALLGRGSQILAELFPGFIEQLVAAGVPILDYTDMSQGFFSFGGHQLIDHGGFSNTPPVFIPSRPLLESLVRRRLRETTNVSLLQDYDVVDLTSNPTSDHVTGTRVRSRHDDGELLLTGDLIVDATGRGSRTPIFLESWGYQRPPEDRIGVRLTYHSQLLRIPQGTLKELIVLVSPVPGRPTAMALFGYENNHWMLTLGGMAGHEPPTDPAGMRSFTKDLAPAHVLAAIEAAEQLGDTYRFRYPESRWRRYDKMRRFPTGLLVTGDAICSFNPIYGQGMTVAALEALALQRCLRRGKHNLARRYFRTTAKSIGLAWRFAAGGDLNLPEVEGPRPLSLRLSNKYVDRLQAAATTDIVVAEQLVKVIGFIDPPSRLLHPTVMRRVATAERLHRDDDHAVLARQAAR